MSNQTAIDAAYALGQQFAEYLNQHPEEAQNWSTLDRGDDLPEHDYVTLRDDHGMTPEIEDAYRDGFNATFAPVS